MNMEIGVLIRPSMYTACMRPGSKGEVYMNMEIGVLIRPSMYIACAWLRFKGQCVGS